MSKKTDDSIEKFFRKAVSRYDTRFRESDWQKMEQMLDAQASLKNNGGSFRTIKRAAYSLAALIIVSGAVYFVTLNNDNSSENKISESKNSPLRETQAAAENKALTNEGNEKKSTAGLLSSETPSEKTEALVQSNNAQSQLNNDNTSLAPKTQNTVRAGSEQKQLSSSDENQTVTTAQEAVKNNRTTDQHDAPVKTGSVSPKLPENATTRNDNKPVSQKPEPGLAVVPKAATSDDHALNPEKNNGVLNQTDTPVTTASVSSEIIGDKTAQNDHESAIQKAEAGKTILPGTEVDDNNVAGATAKVVKKSEGLSKRDASVTTASVSSEITGNKTAQTDDESAIQKAEAGKTILPGTEAGDNNVAGATAKVVKKSEGLNKRDASVTTASVSSEIIGGKTEQNDQESAVQKSESGKTILPGTEADNNVAGATAKVVENSEGLSKRDASVTTASVSSEIIGGKTAQNDHESAIQKSESGKTILPGTEAGDNNGVVGATQKAVKNNERLSESDTPVKTGSLSSGITGNTSAQNDNGTDGQKLKSEKTIVVNAKTKDKRDDESNTKKSFVNAVADTVIPRKDSVDTPDKEAEETFVTEKEENKKQSPELKTGSKWSVFVSLAPDFSSTSSRQLSSPGSAYGFQIAYQLFSRISLHTGLIRSSKKYRSDASDYHPPKGYWGYRTNGVVPDEIKGRCAVWEIPLWVQVDLRQREKSRFYVSAGASGYLMTSQSYDYSFKTENPGAANGWSSSESDTYPLAVGHLSAGYERDITPAIGLGIEPFVKIPFEGMGWSKVNLFTTGFYVNVRYRFLKRVSPL